ncbi:leucine repeat adapter protein 25-like [Amphibalanus amphitrite]|uniref:leucine repeat adapter protein 25-like n=1 Tax=Amphibalanus amphitrite TaxID=1232801 RepID=UPI001C923639|nr:leucine repeat adapter protein 25-like [Amphibalanus amphitrite]XP_043206411.1 leucine repeat adapter protein 25-like [Amphibalanus amphitrite]
MSSLNELPPLPPSLSALLAGPPPLPGHAEDEPTYSNVPPARPQPAPPAPACHRPDAGGSTGRRAAPAAPLPGSGSGSGSGRRSAQLEQQLQRLRQQMSELRQMDLSLLHQLWSLNDAIQELKQAVRSPSWDNGYDGSADEEDGSRREFGALSSVAERLSSSSSSLEYGNI